MKHIHRDFAEVWFTESCEAWERRRRAAYERASWLALLEWAAA